VNTLSGSRATQRHIIKTQIVDLKLKNRAKAQHYYDRVSELIQQALVPQMDAIFSRHFEPDQHYVIDSLELDIGKIHWQAFDEDFVPACVKALEQQIQKALSSKKAQVRPRNADDKSISSREVLLVRQAYGKQHDKDLETKKQALLDLDDAPGKNEPHTRSPLELLNHFMHHGVLPWWADALEPDLLNTQLDQALHHHGGQLKHDVAQWLSLKPATQRLIQHYDDQRLLGLSRLFLSPSTPANTVVSDAVVHGLALIKTASYELVNASQNHLRLNYWQAVLNGLARPDHIKSVFVQGINHGSENISSTNTGSSRGRDKQTVAIHAYLLQSLTQHRPDSAALRMLLLNKADTWLTASDDAKPLSQVLSQKATLRTLQALLEVFVPPAKVKLDSAEKANIRDVVEDPDNTNTRDKAKALGKTKGLDKTKDLGENNTSVKSIDDDALELQTALDNSQQWLQIIAKNGDPSQDLHAFSSYLNDLPSPIFQALSQALFKDDLFADKLFNDNFLNDKMSREDGLNQQSNEVLLKQGIQKFIRYLNNCQEHALDLSPLTEQTIEQVAKSKSQHVDKQTPKDHGRDFKPGIDECYVYNAGLILFWPFLGHFFARLGFFDHIKDGDKKDFADQNAREAAAKLLQSLIYNPLEFGESGAPQGEYLLPLNKVLCGLALDSAVDIQLSPTEDQQMACEHLLKTVIDSAKVLQNTTIAEFQSSFLQRRGLLSQRDGAWLLRVERENQDVLLGRFPWSLEWLKLEWMDSAMRVEWS